MGLTFPTSGAATAGGAASATHTLLETITIATPAADIDFTGISGAHDDLWVRYICRGTLAAAALSTECEANGDTTAANYFRQSHLVGNGNATHVGQEGADTVFSTAVGSTSPANGFTNGGFLIRDYTVAHLKIGRSLSDNVYAAGQLQLDDYVWEWIDTSAITRLRFFPSSGNWDTATEFRLFGITWPT